ncbi:MAG: carboxypeptidase-like regulatory domain-containing protein [Pirellulaceae bacterium]
MLAGILACVVFTTAAFETNQDGYIGGVVVNQSQDRQPVAGSKVVLQMKSNGEFVPLDETTTDAAGRFLFRGLLVSRYVEYKTSAQYEGIHYPGPRIQLTSEQDTVAATLVVRDVVREPNPLRVRDHDIYVQSSPGVLEVTESMWVENLSDRTYVGPMPDSADEEPVTLQLSIPADFQKVTFNQEVLGRSFSIRDGTLVSSIPWEPGKREVKFTYFIRNTQQRRLWERTVDLPTDTLRVQIATATPAEVSCNLERRETTQRAGYSVVLFASDTAPLSAHHVVRLELGKLPVPWTAYGKWGAAVLLIALIVSRSLASRWGRKAAKTQPGAEQIQDSSSSRGETPRNGQPAARRHGRRAA